MLEGEEEDDDDDMDMDGGGDVGEREGDVGRERERERERVGSRKGKGKDGRGENGEIIDAFGTLSISQHGVARFFGPTGGSEVRSNLLSRFVNASAD